MEISKSSGSYKKQDTTLNENNMNCNKIRNRVDVFERVWSNIEVILDQFDKDLSSNSKEIPKAGLIKKSTLRALPFMYR
ncbi:MAG: hypothetical protein JWQ40_4755 [Segetibacter sp.]|jgi:hypothetical protein|nr:hypothetical protein [Segetibacter sp.]